MAGVTPIGLDIGSSSIRAVEVRREPGQGDNDGGSRGALPGPAQRVVAPHRREPGERVAREQAQRQKQRKGLAGFLHVFSPLLCSR